MNREAMARVLAFVQLGDNRHVDALVLDYWMQIVGDLDFETAMNAVIRFRRERPGTYLEPGHLLELAGVVAETRALGRSHDEIMLDLYRERAGLTQAEADAMTPEELAARLATVRPQIGIEEGWAEAGEVDDE